MASLKQVFPLEKYPQALYDWVFFTTDSLYNEKLSQHIYYNTAWLDEEESARHVHKKIWGEIISIPISLSKEVIGKKLDTGVPARENITPEKIREMVEVYKDKTWGRDSYYCTPYYPEEITLDSLTEKMDMQVGDRIYFDYNTLEEENNLGYYNGKMVFKVRYDDVICVVRKPTRKQAEEMAPEYKQHLENKYKDRIIPIGEIIDFILNEGNRIIMQAGWTLIRPEMEKWEEFTTQSGIITKCKLDPKPLRGFISYIDHSDFGLKKGDRIVFHPDANWLNIIEGIEYYVIKEKDILGIFDN